MGKTKLWVTANGGPLLLALATWGLLEQGHAEFRRDELECEEALARLLKCCPSADFSLVSCEYLPGCGSPSYPAIGVEQSQCLRDLSCDEILDNGVCEWVAEVRDSSNEPNAPGALCPWQ